jgi:glutaredoxin-related protein
MKNNAMGLSLPDVLLLVGIHSRTGELVIESGNNIGTLLVHEGKILQAFSPYSRAIGDLLVEDGLITENELIETLKLQKQNQNTPLGALLLKMGKVTFEVIEMMVHEQIRQAMKEYLSWDDVAFSFTDKHIHPYDRINLSVYEFIPLATIQAAKAFLSLPLSSTVAPLNPVSSSTTAGS